MAFEGAVRAAGPSRVAVLMTTLDGGRFVDDQLQSVIEQDWPAIDMWVSDDGSGDDTPRRLQQWAGRWGKGTFHIVTGPGRGFSANYRQLIATADIDAAFVAFCDQDDVWLADKLPAAIAALRQHGNRPALCCERTILTDSSGRDIGLSPLFQRAPGFANALVQSIGGGNTMVMNAEAFALLREAALRTDFVSHDWFAYLIVSGAGGKVIYSEVPHVRYRQHDRNLIGANTGWRARFNRLRFALHGRFAGWTDSNLQALDACRDLLTPDSVALFDRFKDARRGNPIARLIKLWRSGVHRQTVFGQVSLYVAGMMGKL